MAIAALLTVNLSAEPIPVRFPQASADGFLVVQTMGGVRVASGDAMQTVRGGRVVSRVVFRFPDGSLDDETTVFSQHVTFALISDHHIQRGPIFPKPIDVFIDAASGLITSRQPDGSVTSEHLDLPSDLSNGLPPNLLLNILPSTPETKLHFVAPTSKPRLVQVSVKPAGQLATSGSSRVPRLPAFAERARFMKAVPSGASNKSAPSLRLS